MAIKHQFYLNLMQHFIGQVHIAFEKQGYSIIVWQLSSVLGCSCQNSKDLRFQSYNPAVADIFPPEHFLDSLRLKFILSKSVNQNFCFLCVKSTTQGVCLPQLYEAFDNINLKARSWNLITWNNQIK